MKVSSTFRIAAPDKRIWHIIGEEFDQVSAWSSTVDTSKPDMSALKIGGAPVGGRICHTCFGVLTETIEDYNDVERYIEYSVTSDDIPFFIDVLRGRWTLTPRSSDATDVTFAVTADLKFPFSVLAGWAVKRRLTNVVHNTLSELAAFACRDFDQAMARS